MLRESILASVELFDAKQFFLSDEFSLVDCSIAPVLWRLPVYGIELGSHAEPIERYMKRVFERRSFQESLTELEQEMRL
jgi:RNA polymerase-associated protein